MAAQTHQSDVRVLDRRSLERDFSRLAELLRPGMDVFDIGCGTGAITAGIARAVGPNGQVIGADRDRSLIGIAQKQHGSVPNLAFAPIDIVTLEPARTFDIVCAARVLQWISEPLVALRNMARSTKRGGVVVVLDYTHEDNAWEPEAPAEFQRFYAAFLDWRTANGWDNRMGDHLPALFEQAGLKRIESRVSDQSEGRGAELWLNVIQSMGPTLAGAGYLGIDELRSAEETYASYLRSRLDTQRLAMRTVEGTMR